MTGNQGSKRSFCQVSGPAVIPGVLHTPRKTSFSKKKRQKPKVVRTQYDTLAVLDKYVYCVMLFVFYTLTFGKTQAAIPVKMSPSANEDKHWSTAWVIIFFVIPMIKNLFLWFWNRPVVQRQVRKAIHWMEKQARDDPIHVAFINATQAFNNMSAEMDPIVDEIEPSIVDDVSVISGPYENAQSVRTEPSRNVKSIPPVDPQVSFQAFVLALCYLVGRASLKGVKKFNFSCLWIFLCYIVLHYTGAPYWVYITLLIPSTFFSSLLNSIVISLTIVFERISAWWNDVEHQSVLTRSNVQFLEECVEKLTPRVLLRAYRNMSETERAVKKSMIRGHDEDEDTCVGGGTVATMESAQSVPDGYSVEVECKPVEVSKSNGLQDILLYIGCDSTNKIIFDSGAAIMGMVLTESKASVALQLYVLVSNIFHRARAMHGKEFDRVLSTLYADFHSFLGFKAEDDGTKTVDKESSMPWLEQVATEMGKLAKFESSLIGNVGNAFFAFITTVPILLSDLFEADTYMKRWKIVVKTFKTTGVSLHKITSCFSHFYSRVILATTSGEGKSALRLLLEPDTFNTEYAHCCQIMANLTTGTSIPLHSERQRIAQVVNRLRARAEARAAASGSKEDVKLMKDVSLMCCKIVKEFSGGNRRKYFPYTLSFDSVPGTGKTTFLASVIKYCHMYYPFGDILDSIHTSFIKLDTKHDNSTKSWTTTVVLEDQASLLPSLREKTFASVLMDVNQPIANEVVKAELEEKHMHFYNNIFTLITDNDRTRGIQHEMSVPFAGFRRLERCIEVKVIDAFSDPSGKLDKRKADEADLDTLGTHLAFRPYMWQQVSGKPASTYNLVPEASHPEFGDGFMDSYDFKVWMKKDLVNHFMEQKAIIDKADKIDFSRPCGCGVNPMGFCERCGNHMFDAVETEAEFDDLKAEADLFEVINNTQVALADTSAWFGSRAHGWLAHWVALGVFVQDPKRVILAKLLGTQEIINGIRIFMTLLFLYIWLEKKFNCTPFAWICYCLLYVCFAWLEFFRGSYGETVERLQRNAIEDVMTMTTSLRASFGGAVQLGCILVATSFALSNVKTLTDFIFKQFPTKVTTLKETKNPLLKGKEKVDETKLVAESGLTPEPDEPVTCEVEVHPPQSDDAKNPGGTTSWVAQKRTEFEGNHCASTITMSDLTRKVERNCTTVRFTGANHKADLCGWFLDSTTFVSAAHQTRNGSRHEGGVLEIDTQPGKTDTKPISIQLTEKNCWLANDVLIVKVTGAGFPPKTDLRPYVTTSIKTLGKKAVRIVRNSNGGFVHVDTEATEGKWDRVYSYSSGSSRVEVVGLQAYRSLEINGQCGLPIMTVSNPHVICAIHTSGLDLSCGGALLTQQMLEMADAHFLTNGLYRTLRAEGMPQRKAGKPIEIGEVNPTHPVNFLEKEVEIYGGVPTNMSPRSEMKLHPNVQQAKDILGVQPKKDLPVMRWRESTHDVLNHALKEIPGGDFKYIFEASDFQVDRAVAAADKLMEKYPDWDWSRPLTQAEVLNGVEGMPMARIDRSKSSGIGGKKGDYIIEIDVEGSEVPYLELSEELKHDLLQITEELDKFVDPMFVHKSCMKDELQGMKNGKRKPVRLFYCSPITEHILLSQYFRGCLEAVAAFPEYFDTAAGLNIHGQKWVEHMRPFFDEAFKNLVSDLDQEKFDASQMEVLRGIATRPLIHMNSRFGFSDRDIRRCHALLSSTTRPLLNLQGVLMRLERILPSGILLTLLMNGLYNSLIVRSSLLKFGDEKNQPIDLYVDIFLKTMGDDLLVSVKAALHKGGWTLNDLIDHAASWGMKMTSADKTGVPKLGSYDEKEFLKSYSNWHPEIKRNVNVIGPDSYFNPLYAHVRGKNWEVNLYTSDIIDNILKNAFMGGRKSFEFLKPRLEEFVKASGLIRPLSLNLTFDDWVDKVKSEPDYEPQEQVFQVEDRGMELLNKYYERTGFDITTRMDFVAEADTEPVANFDLPDGGNVTLDEPAVVDTAPVQAETSAVRRIDRTFLLDTFEWPQEGRLIAPFQAMMEQMPVRDALHNVAYMSSSIELRFTIVAPQTVAGRAMASIYHPPDSLLPNLSTDVANLSLASQKMNISMRVGGDDSMWTLTVPFHHPMKMVNPFDSQSMGWLPKVIFFPMTDLVSSTEVVPIVFVKVYGSYVDLQTTGATALRSPAGWVAEASVTRPLRRTRELEEEENGYCYLLLFLPSVRPWVKAIYGSYPQLIRLYSDLMEFWHPDELYDALIVDGVWHVSQSANGRGAREVYRFMCQNGPDRVGARRGPTAAEKKRMISNIVPIPYCPQALNLVDAIMRYRHAIVCNNPQCMHMPGVEPRRLATNAKKCKTMKRNIAHYMKCQNDECTVEECFQIRYAIAHNIQCPGIDRRGEHCFVCTEVYDRHKANIITDVLRFEAGSMMDGFCYLWLIVAHGRSEARETLGKYPLVKDVLQFLKDRPFLRTGVSDLDIRYGDYLHIVRFVGRSSFNDIFRILVEPKNMTKRLGGTERFSRVVKNVASAGKSVGQFLGSGSIVMASDLIGKAGDTLHYFGFSKPISQGTQIQIAPNLANAQGDEVTGVVSVERKQEIAMNNLGLGDELSFEAFSRRWSLVHKREINLVAMPGEVIMQYNVTPQIMLEDGSNWQPASCAMPALFTHSWKGGMEYRLECVGPNSVSVLANIYYDPLVEGNTSEDGTTNRFVNEDLNQFVAHDFGTRPAVEFTIGYTNNRPALLCSTSNIVDYKNFYAADNGVPRPKDVEYHKGVNIGAISHWDGVADPAAHNGFVRVDLASAIVGGNNPALKVVFLLYARAAPDMQFGQYNGALAYGLKGPPVTEPGYNVASEQTCTIETIGDDAGLCAESAFNTPPKETPFPTTNSANPTMITPPLPTPTSAPSKLYHPSRLPSMVPSNVPTKTASSQPSFWPSLFPSEASEEPSNLPSLVTIGPSKTPSIGPSIVPSSVPSTLPTMVHSTSPSSKPSELASDAPSTQPSTKPSSQPTTMAPITPSPTLNVRAQGSPGLVTSAVQNASTLEAPYWLNAENVNEGEMAVRFTSNGSVRIPSYPDDFGVRRVGISCRSVSGTCTLGGVTVPTTTTTMEFVVTGFNNVLNVTVSSGGDLRIYSGALWLPYHKCIKTIPPPGPAVDLNDRGFSYDPPVYVREVDSFVSMPADISILPSNFNFTVTCYGQMILRVNGQDNVVGEPGKWGRYQGWTGDNNGTFSLQYKRADSSSFIYSLTYVANGTVSSVSDHSPARRLTTRNDFIAEADVEDTQTLAPVVHHLGAPLVNDSTYTAHCTGEQIASFRALLKISHPVVEISMSNGGAGPFAKSMAMYMYAMEEENRSCLLWSMYNSFVMVTGGMISHYALMGDCALEVCQIPSTEFFSGRLKQNRNGIILADSRIQPFLSVKIPGQKLTNYTHSAMENSPGNIEVITIHAWNAPVKVKKYRSTAEDFNLSMFRGAPKLSLA